MHGKRLLVVEDDAALRNALTRWGDQGGWRTEGAGSVAEALDGLERSPHVIVTDVLLPDGSAIGLVEAARAKQPAPVVVAMSGKASAEQGFRLALAGAAAYLGKPFSLKELGDAIASAIRQPPGFDAHLALQVGRVPLATVQREVRSIMLEQALALTGANRSRAGRLLGVSRQAVQQMLRAASPPRP